MNNKKNLQNQITYWLFMFYFLQLILLILIVIGLAIGFLWSWKIAGWYFLIMFIIILIWDNI